MPTNITVKPGPRQGARTVLRARALLEARTQHVPEAVPSSESAVRARLIAATEAAAAAAVTAPQTTAPPLQRILSAATVSAIVPRAALSDTPLATRCCCFRTSPRNSFNTRDPVPAACAAAASSTAGMATCAGTAAPPASSAPQAPDPTTEHTSGVADNPTTRFRHVAWVARIAATVGLTDTKELGEGCGADACAASARDCARGAAFVPRLAAHPLVTQGP